MDTPTTPAAAPTSAPVAPPAIVSPAVLTAAPQPAPAPRAPRPVSLLAALPALLPYLSIPEAFAPPLAPGATPTHYGTRFPVMVWANYTLPLDNNNWFIRVVPVGDENPVDAHRLAFASDAIDAWGHITRMACDIVGHVASGAITGDLKIRLIVKSNGHNSELPLGGNAEGIDADPLARMLVVGLFDELRARVTERTDLEKMARVLSAAFAHASMPKPAAKTAPTATPLTLDTAPKPRQKPPLDGPLPEIPKTNYFVNGYRSTKDDADTLRLRVAMTREGAFFPDNTVPESKMLFALSPDGFRDFTDFVLENKVTLVYFPPKLPRKFPAGAAEAFMAHVRQLYPETISELSPTKADGAPGNGARLDLIDPDVDPTAPVADGIGD